MWTLTSSPFASSFLPVCVFLFCYLKAFASETQGGKEQKFKGGISAWRWAKSQAWCAGGGKQCQEVTELDFEEPASSSRYRWRNLSFSQGQVCTQGKPDGEPGHFFSVLRYWGQSVK